MAALEREIRKKAGELSVRSPVFYHLSDEGGLLRSDLNQEIDLCFSPETLTAFREHLKHRFGALEAVNERWDTAFASWEEVVPLKTDEVRKRMDNIAPWLDFRIFMAHEFAGLFGKIQDWIREEDGREGVYVALTRAAMNPYTCAEPAIIANSIDMAYVSFG
jgi:hypothetical protein